ncbi:MAG: ABC transporter substrate-binding protein [Chloroflexi bacterium]|nr:ABC transporter substrate-binding protein [Chloroflexota bacterium]
MLSVPRPSLRLAAPRRWGARRAVLSVLVLALALVQVGWAALPASRALAADNTVTVTDIVGRSVTVNAPVSRMLLGEARLLYLVSVLEKENPFQRIVGWPNDLRTADYDAYVRYKEAFPQLAAIPEFGSISSGAFSAEQAIELRPDVLVLSYDTYGPARESGLIDKLEKVGVPTVVVDFRQQPLENTVPSTLLLGRLMGKQEEAQRFVDYYLQQVNLVYSRIGGLTEPAPTAFLHRAPGLLECCATFGRANLGILIERAGGVNLGSDRIPGWAGTINPEQVLTSDPDLVIATGSNWSQYSGNKTEGVGFVSLGYGADPDEARAQLLALTEQPGWGSLQAVRNRRFYAVWHQFYNSPYHFVVLQQFAKWLHPDRFSDLDPEQTFREFHQAFLPISYSGAFWVSLDD